MDNKLPTPSEFDATMMRFNGSIERLAVAEEKVLELFKRCDIPPESTIYANFERLKDLQMNVTERKVVTYRVYSQFQAARKKQKKAIRAAKEGNFEIRDILSKTIYEQLKIHKMTQAQFAKKLSVSVGTANAIAQGNVDLRVDLLPRIAKVFGITLYELMRFDQI